MKYLRCFATNKKTDLPTFSHVWQINIISRKDKQCLIVDDETRVVLEEIPGVLGSDYINASWINVRENKTLHLHELIILPFSGL